jgi:hypothetical protein
MIPYLLIGSINSIYRSNTLRKEWRGYVIAKNKHEYDNMKYYTFVVQKLQHELGLKTSLFRDIRLSDNNNDDIELHNTRT